ncbi:MAG: serine/threonine-protein kinase [Vicinamibacteraceae bacterium]
MDVIDTRRWQRASRLLDQALDLPHQQLDTWLGELRASDSDAAADVEALLLEHRQLNDEGFLDGGMPSIDVPLTGVTLGGYTLVSPIDQGGMGSVWLAERSDGRFQGRAAVKLLNASLLGREGEARFRREGTVLAKLTHPHIARLIDAGVSRAGQPYLVLEYVDGQHIDRYCDDHRLGVEERIRLFLDIQAAVAHAHANLIVHRDLKPSNVLVGADGQVKLLDFGIAKLLGNDEAISMLTREGGVALTPKYAAPEQVTAGPITTATDVYTLGVLLFELLTGHHPTGLAAGSPLEFVKAITVGKTMRLSAAALGDDTRLAAERAEQRATTPERLQRVLRGDLETIVAKALKSNPEERYASVAEFAEDLRRVLEHQPITARPDTLRYRATKFGQRHWRPLAAALGALVVLVAVVVFYTQRLQSERDRARQEADKASRVSELLTSVLIGADPYRNPDSTEQTVQGLLDRAAERTGALEGQPEVQTQMFAIIGRTFQRMGLSEKALPLLQRALALGRRSLGPEHVQLAQSLNNLGVLHREMGHAGQAEPLLREAVEMRRHVLGARHPDVAITLVELSRVLAEQGRVEEAEPLSREALAIRREVFGDEHRETATSKRDLGLNLMRRGDLAGAEPLLRENVDTTVRLLGPAHPNSASAMATMAQLLEAKGDLAGAEPFAEQAAEANRRTFGPDAEEYAQMLSQLSGTLELLGRLDEAERGFADCLRIGRAQLAADHPLIATYQLNLSRVRIARGDGAATEPLLRAALRLRATRLRAEDWRIGEAQSLLAAALVAGGRVSEAEPLMLAADRLMKPIPGGQARARADNRARLVALYRASGRPIPADLTH